MDGLMSPQAQKMLAILEELQFGENASGAFRTGNLGSGNPVGRVEKMVGAGAGGPGMMGRWQEASGKPLWSFQDPGSMELQQQAAPQGQRESLIRPGADGEFYDMPVITPAELAKQGRLYEEAEQLMNQMDPPITDPDERMRWATEYVATLMGAQQ